MTYYTITCKGIVWKTKSSRALNIRLSVLKSFGLQYDFSIQEGEQ